MMKKRIVITGIGVISSIGIGKEAFWKSLKEGKSGISDVISFDTSKHQTHKGGEVKDFLPENYIDKKQLKTLGRCSQLTLAATKLALKDADLKEEALSGRCVGFCVGTTLGEIPSVEDLDRSYLKSGIEGLDSITICQYPVMNLATVVLDYYRLKGPARIFTTACAAGNYAIGAGYDLIQEDEAEVVLAGGADPFSYIAFTGFNQLRSYAPEKCQPFDKNRKGMIVGEGAGILVLETLERALSRRARIYAEVLGYGTSCDAYHMTNTQADGIFHCMNDAIRKTNIDIKSIDYICAHGTGTLHNDKAESQAIKRILKEKNKEVLVSSIKSMIGHTMGAASAMGAIACCLAINESMAPPTINFETPDPECDIDCVPNKARKRNVRIALNNGFAFGGNNACLVLKKIR